MHTVMLVYLSCLLLTACATFSDVDPDRPDALLYSNGNIITHNDGSGGAYVSESVDALGLECNEDFFIYENFTVPDGEEWFIEDIEVFAFQRTSGLTSTITGLYVWIHQDAPFGPHVFGFVTVNILTSSEFSGIYRVVNGGNHSDTDNPIMRNVGAVNTLFTSGVYWIAFYLRGSMGRGPECPYVDGGELYILDTASGGQGNYDYHMPFKFYGYDTNDATNEANEDKNDSSSTSSVSVVVIVIPVVVGVCLLIALCIFFAMARKKKYSTVQADNNAATEEEKH